MGDAGSGAHALGQPGFDDPVVALGVAMLDRAFEHPGDDLHVAVRVRAEAAARRDHVVVDHQELPVVGVVPVVVVAEAEAVPRVEPVDLRVEPVLGAVHGRRHVLHDSCYCNHCRAKRLRLVSRRAHCHPPLQ
jgi:hypothetical protein